MKKLKHSLWYQYWSSILSLFFVGLVFVLASLCWFVEHSYNFLAGKGWRGTPLI